VTLDEIFCECEIVYVGDDGIPLSEASIRQWKRVGDTLKQKYRCLAGSKEGKLVANPGDCAARKDPKRVRIGRKVMRAKKGSIARQSKITKKTSASRMVARMNKRLAGK